MKRGIARHLRRVLAWAVLFALLPAGCDRVHTLFGGGRCILSDREMHAGMAVRGIVEGAGKSGDICCLRCALTYAIQTDRTVTISSVTDYDTGRHLRPREAVYVVASDVKPCSAPATYTPGNRGECLVLAWDRCNPSIIAFASKADADRFRDQHGGQIETFEQIADSVPKGKIRSD